MVKASSMARLQRLEASAALLDNNEIESPLDRMMKKEAEESLRKERERMSPEDREGHERLDRWLAKNLNKPHSQSSGAFAIQMCSTDLPQTIVLEDAARREITACIRREFPGRPIPAGREAFAPFRSAWASIWASMAWELASKQVPVEDRRYFFDPDHPKEIEEIRDFENRPRNLRVLSLWILIDPQGRKRQRAIAFARKWDRRSAQHFDGMAFSPTSRQMLPNPSILPPGMSEFVTAKPYRGPTSLEEWWEGLHARNPPF